MYLYTDSKNNKKIKVIGNKKLNVAPDLKNPVILDDIIIDLC